MQNHPANRIQLWTLQGSSLQNRLADLTRFVFAQAEHTALSYHPAWLQILHRALGHQTYAIEARIADHTCGYLPLAYVESMLFGRFLSSLPYLNSNGVMATSADLKTMLISRGIELAQEFNVKQLELRHEQAVEHTQLNGTLSSKVQMRMSLPESVEQLWNQLDSKVRNQIRKGDKHDLHFTWGGQDLINPFYSVLSANMRDLGTPFYSQDFFEQILETFPNHAEIGITWLGEVPITAALLLHGRGITEVPTASSLREYNSTCANMWMYHQLLIRSVERQQKCFDFGRSTLDGPTFKFKKQWGAEPCPTTWQYYLQHGTLGEMRPDNPRYQRMIAIWKRLPLSVTQWLGPKIVRGIP